MKAGSILANNLEKLASEKQRIDIFEKLRIKEAAENFEAIFINFMLKSMMKIGDGRDSLFGEDSFGADVLDSVFFLELSRHIARNGRFGIAETIYRQLTGEEFDPKLFQAFPVKRGMKTENLKHTGKELKKLPTRKFFSRYGVSLIERINKFEGIISSVASKFDVDADLIKAIIAVESSGDIFARSGKGAKGLMQLIDSTAELVGVKNIWNPAENIYGGVKYFRMLLDRFDGNVELALAAYNAGPEAVAKNKGIPPYPETRNYVRRVLKYFKMFKINSGKNG